MNEKNNATYNDRPEIPIIEELKNVLKNFKYNDIPLDRIYRTQFIIEYWSGAYTIKKTSFLNVLMVRIYLLLKLLFLKIKSSPDTSILDNTVLIETMSVENRLKGFWLPLLQNNKELQLTLLGCPHIENYIGNKQPTINTAVLEGDFWKIFNWFTKNYSGLIKEIRIICKRYNLSKYAAEMILNTLLSTVVSIEQYTCLFKKHRPLGFIAIDDQHVNGAIICNILNSYQVPTYTHIHGAVGIQSMIDFVPLNSQYALCWGEYMKQLFISNGVLSERLYIAGCQRSEKDIIISQDRSISLKKKIGIQTADLTKPVILFGFTRLITDNWINDLRILANVLSEKYQLIGRLHPSSIYKDLSEYNIEGTGNLIISESSVISLNEHIALSDIVIIDSSTMGFDAMLQGKTVIVLDSANELKTQDVMMDVIQANAAQFCRSATEVIAFLSDTIKQNMLKINAEKFIGNYIKSYGNESANEILNIVSRNLNSGKIQA